MTFPKRPTTEEPYMDIRQMITNLEKMGSKIDDLENDLLEESHRRTRAEMKLTICYWVLGVICIASTALAFFIGV